MKLPTSSFPIFEPQNPSTVQWPTRYDLYQQKKINHSHINIFLIDMLFINSANFSEKKQQDTRPKLSQFLSIKIRRSVNFM